MFLKFKEYKRRYGFMVMKRRLLPLFSLLLYCVAAVGQTAKDNDNGFYLALGIAAMFTEDTLFVDGGSPDSDLPKLYGRTDIYTDSRIDTSMMAHIGAGYRFSARLRAQLEFNISDGLELRGNTNYLNAGDSQPASAELDLRQLLFSAFYDFPSLQLDSGLQVRPYLGAGIGISDYDLGDFVQTFPALRRGADGSVALTRLPDGDGQEFAYMLNAGIVIPLTARAELDLGYRYTDLGEIKTAVGDITIERYRQDGSRRPDISVGIDETVAELKTHAVLFSFRLWF